MGIQPAFQRFICKNLLDSRLGIVKIAAYSHNKGIVPLLCHHLLFLDWADPILWIKNYNTSALHICKSCQRRFSRISGGSSQNHDLIPDMVLSGCRGHQMRQYGKRHILKRNRRPMKQLQIPGAVRLCQRGNFFSIKFAVISLCNTVFQLFFCIICQIQLHDLIRSLLITHTCIFFQSFVQRRNPLRNKQPAVIRQPF